MGTTLGEEYIELTKQGLLLVLYISMPPILVATIFGLGVGLLQSLTQVQEQTLPTAVKLIAIMVVLIFGASLTSSQLYEYTTGIFDRLADYSLARP